MNPKVESPLFIRLVICSMIVCLMCPIMSMIATLLFKSAGVEIIAIWLETAAFNFPMALAWQIFFGGAIVRYLDKKIASSKA